MTQVDQIRICYSVGCDPRTIALALGAPWAVVVRTLLADALEGSDPATAAKALLCSLGESCDRAREDAP